MIKLLLPVFFLIFSSSIFSQGTADGNLNLESIIGFEVAEVTDANIEALGMKPSAGAKGVKLIHFGPKIVKVKNLMSMSEGVEGDILTNIYITNKFGKIFENRAIWGLKDFCNVLIQYKEKGGNYHVLAYALKTHNDKTRQYLIDINALNSGLLTQYVLNIDKPKTAETQKNNISAKRESPISEEKTILSIQSILGFEVCQPTLNELETVGQNPSAGEGGVKIVSLGYKLTKAANSPQDGKPAEGDIITNIIVNNKWGKQIENRPIKDLKDFCSALIQYKQREGKFTLIGRTFEKVPKSSDDMMMGMMGAMMAASTSHKYTIDISNLNTTLLTLYMENIDLSEKIVEKPKAELKAKNNSTAKNTKRNSEDEEESKDIYASSVDFTNPGKFYAIIIGSSAYKDPGIPDLDSLPIKDAMALKNVLCKKYIFEKENVKALYNPTRRDIVIAFADMSKKITPNDNLLIFYAGHGHYEKESDIGYWLPTDAEVSNPSNWLYNDQLVADVKKIKSLHTLLISDACFSGSIFKTRAVNMEEANSFIKQKYALPSRKAITSGTLKTVPNKSVFIKYLLDRLTNNKEAFFTASQLFQSLEQPVSNNSKSLPQFGVIQNVGDEGGDFIFIKR